MKFDCPIRLESERAWRTYHGGKILDEMHGVSPARDTHFPEDWIISTVRAINAGREDVVEGLNRLANEVMATLCQGEDALTTAAGVAQCGQGVLALSSVKTLADLIAAEPEAMLGKAHVAKWGISTAVLVKLIDAAERLGVQGHPDKERARQFFGSAFGKTECWHIVGGRTIDGEKPCVYMGFKPGITEAKWRDVFDRQDIPEMLGLLHRIEVKPGDTFLIEGGMPHAIGAGCLLMEIQEPTDYTFRTEKVTPQGFAISEKACHYGIGFDNMFSCFHYEGHDEAETRRLRMVAPEKLEETASFTRTRVVGYTSTPCFELERFDIRGTCPFTGSGTFSGLYVFSGKGTLDGAPIGPGSQFFVPAVCRDFTVVAEEPLVLFRAKSAAL